MDGHGDAVGQLRMWGDPQDTAETPMWGRAIKGSGCVGHKNGVCVCGRLWGLGSVWGGLGGVPMGSLWGWGPFWDPRRLLAVAAGFLWGTTGLRGRGHFRSRPPRVAPPPVSVSGRDFRVMTSQPETPLCPPPPLWAAMWGRLWGRQSMGHPIYRAGYGALILWGHFLGAKTVGPAMGLSIL